MYEIFKAEVTKQCKLRKLKYRDLAKMTGIKRSTIAAFMCGARDSDLTKKALERALDIK